MRMAHHRKRIVCNAVQAVLFGWLTFLPLPGMAALERMDEAAMSNVSGAGLAFVWEDFRWLTKPTSYFEQVGSGTDPESTFLRGDLRWYGINVSAKGAGTTWTETGSSMDACASQGYGGLGCPRGGTIAHFAAHDNPYVLRVMDYSGKGSGANQIGNGVVTWGGDTSTSKTVLELLAPTFQEDYRFSFWGEIEAGKGGPATDYGLLKTQTIIQGNAVGSVLQFFQSTEAGNPNFAFLYKSHLQGDFRFSANQVSGKDSDALGTPVQFDAFEGMHFRNVDAFLPLGHLFYQAFTIDVPKDASGNDITNGNFVLALNEIPDNPAVYRRHYSLAVADSVDAGYQTARAALLANTYGATPSITVPENYFQTHGYSRWGDWFPCQGVGCPAVPTSMTVTDGTGAIIAQRNTFNDTSDGIFFSKCSGCTDFDAFAYTMTAVDVRAGQSQYNCPGGTGCSGDGYNPRGTGSRFYKQNDSCTPSGGTGLNCGYGGGYSISAGSAYTNTSKVNPQAFFDAASAGTQTLPVMRTGVANLGDSRAEGLLINSFKFTSLGAQY